MSKLYKVTYSDSLSHHGIKGMHWGIRRFQNEDGSLTGSGRKRYSLGFGTKNRSSNKKGKLSDKQKKALKIGVAIAVAGLAAYGAYKINQNNKILTAEMKDANDRIEFGRNMVKRLESEFSSNYGQGDNPWTQKSITYLGNDLKYHKAEASVITDGSNYRKKYTNYDSGTQKVFENLREYKKAKKRAGL